MTQAQSDALEQELQEAMAIIDRVKAKLDAVEIEPEKVTGWAGPGNERYLFIDNDNAIERSDMDDNAYCIANKFTNTPEGRALAERISKQQTIMRKLQRFSDENGGQEIDWRPGVYGYYIDFIGGDLCVFADETKSPFRVYFKTPETCTQAIEKFGPQIMEAWGLGGDEE
jgi:hypothetical protein